MCKTFKTLSESAKSNRYCSCLSVLSYIVSKYMQTGHGYWKYVAMLPKYNIPDIQSIIIYC